jgi:hypothetical protein
MIQKPKHSGDNLNPNTLMDPELYCGMKISMGITLP